MSHLNKDLVFLILQYLREEGFEESARMLELESGSFFEMKFFEGMVLSGNWDGAENYLSGFTKFNDNRYSRKIYFELRKQKFLEALDREDRAKALDILMKDLKVFAEYNNKELFEQMTQLLTMDDIRENESLSAYEDTETARKILLLELEKIIAENPIFHEKLKFPCIQSHRLRRLINQSLNWQHQHCNHPQPNPDVRTLFEDHVCQPLEDHSISVSIDNDPLSSQSTFASEPTLSASSNSTRPIETTSTAFGQAACLHGLANLATDNLEHATSVSQNEPNEETSTITQLNENPNNTQVDLPILDIEVMTESCTISSNVELPRRVARILNQSSLPTSMAFHPVEQSLLLVGTDVGSIGIWEASNGEKLVWRNFQIWDTIAISQVFQTELHKDTQISVNRVAWSPEGSLIGIAYSKHLVQLYSYHGGNDVRQQLQIDAHVGGVNDLVFSVPKKKLVIVTCGDDKIVKVWDASSGVKLLSFEGHNAPVYSLCPQNKDNVHFILSISVDGNIKAWLYDTVGCRVDVMAPGFASTRMAYSSDCRRLFSCGTGISGESFLVEWDETKGSIERRYQGLQKSSSSTVQFDVLKNQYLAAGDEHLIKIWDMNKVDLFTTIGADGELPENPVIRFNKDGTLLAVLANENRIKILATDYGLKLLQQSGYSSVCDSGFLSDTFKELAINPSSSVAGAGAADKVFEKNGDQESLEVAISKFTGKAVPNVRKLFEINRPAQCQILCLPLHVKANKILRLTYNNAGNAILALASNAIHLFWKWSLLNSSCKATTEVPPKLWRPGRCSGPMTNDLAGTNLEGAVPCFALSKNDSYLMSASGGKITLFNLMTFKVMLSIMPPPPAATCVAFHPQDNNLVAIGRNDSTILIYNVRLAKVISKLEGHSKRVSGLSFSNSLSILVSSGEDAQLFVWKTEGWANQGSRYLQIPEEAEREASSDTHIQFHHDQIRFLAVNRTHLAIYEAKGLECLNQWNPKDSVPISHATFACDSQKVYACFSDGTICIFDATFELHCRIISTSYLIPSSSLDAGSSYNAYPVAIAAHPQEPNQFAVGLTDGQVIVFEPPKATGSWSI